MIATKDIPKGEEVYLGYSDTSTTFQNFYGYGFIQQTHEYDTVHLCLAIKEAYSPGYKSKVKKLKDKHRK